METSSQIHNIMKSLSMQIDQVELKKSPSIDPDMIRQYIQKKEEESKPKPMGSNLSIDGSASGSRFLELDEDDTNFSQEWLSHKKQVYALLEAAKEYINKKDYENGIEHYLKTLLLVSDTTKSENMRIFKSCKLELANIYIQTNRPSEAKRHILELLEIDTHCSEAMQLLNLILLTSK